jgi:hypothetical protein
MTEMIEYILPLFSGSNFIFFVYISNDDARAPYIALIGIGLGLLHAFLPMH